MDTSQMISESSYLVATPVNFKLSVNKRDVNAQFVSTSFLDGLGYLLKINFSDGHEDEYELDAFGVYTADGKADEYCKALQKEIYKPLWGWNPDQKTYVFNFPINNKDTNIWLIDKNDEYFSVYYSNEFRFQIKKADGQWSTRIPEAYEEKVIDKELLDKVITALNYYTA